MSIESAIAALSGTEVPQNAPKIDSKAPTVQSPTPIQESSASPTLESVIKPPIAQKPAIGSDRFAALAKKERAIQKQMAEIKAKEARLSEFDKLKGTNPLEALKALGYTYDQLTQFLLNGQQPTPELQVKQVKDEVDALKRQQEEAKQADLRARREAAVREERETIEDFKNEIRSFVESNKAEYELTDMYQGQDIVYATIEQYFANTRKVMSIKEATGLIEKYFEDQVKAAQKTKKFQGSTESKDKGQVKVESEIKQSSPTLNNNLVSSAPSLLPAKTENARMARAMAALSK